MHEDEEQPGEGEGRFAVHSSLLIVVGAMLVILAGSLFRTGAAGAPAATPRAHQWSCGAAALLAIADKVDPSAGNRLARALADEPTLLQGACSLLDLARRAREFGLCARGVSISDISACPPFSIVHCSDGHFVALTAVTPDRVHVIDDGQVRAIDTAEFQRLFSGAALLISAGKPPGDLP